MPKSKLYRRFFNPQEAQIKVRQLVAVFKSGMEVEAQACLELFQDYATKFDNSGPCNKHFQKFRFTLEADKPKTVAASESKDVIVDVSKARPTKRPITYELSWQMKHNVCSCLAYHKQYGSIRGEMEDSPQGRRLFVNRIGAVWPNAKIVAR